MFADYNDPAVLASFASIACPSYVNVNSIHPQTDRLFGTETLCGDYSGRLLVLAQDLTTADRIRERQHDHPGENPFRHRASNRTNKTLVDVLRNLGESARTRDTTWARRLSTIDFDGTNSRECGVVYGSIVWLLKDTKSVSSSLPKLQQVLEASKPVIQCAVRSMPNLERIVCLGSIAYEGLARMHGLTNEWHADLARHGRFEIPHVDGKGMLVFPTSHIGGMGLAGRSKFPDAGKRKALEACRSDFDRALQDI
jgi:hypothetical protein